MCRFLIGSVFFFDMLLAYAAVEEPYCVVNQYPHDHNAFTQGLVFHQNQLYESTGLYGFSSVRQVELETGEVLKQKTLADTDFGEGLTVWKQQLVQLTWRGQHGFTYDVATLKPLNSFSYATEGWGLTHDGQSLIMSDGSNKLHFLLPDSFKLSKSLLVYDDNMPIDRLNELEYVDGVILANVWKKDKIAKISPQTGKILSWIVLPKQIRQHHRVPNNVLNGIAYDTEKKKLFITGKRWGQLFVIAPCVTNVTTKNK